MNVDVEVQLAVGPQARVVGRLLDADRRIYFEYDSSFLKSGFELSPFKLPLRPGVFSDGPADFRGLPGLFHDALPDGWGLLLMHRCMRAEGLEPDRMSVLAWQRFMGDRAMGALTFHPATGPLQNRALELSLKKLEAESTQVMQGDVQTLLPALELAGGSPGGARPKVVVGVGPGDALVAGAGELPFGFEPWLVKFAAPGDPTDMGPLEETYARLARRAGIDMPETRLFALSKKRWAFGVRRFDRVKQRRVHVHTIGGLLHASHRLPSLDYQTVVHATVSLTRDRTQVAEAFRRAAFNVLACNRDDHAHNTAYQMSDRGEWALTPAFDLTPSNGPGGYHTTSVMGEAQAPSKTQLLSLGAATALTPAVAQEALSAVESAIDQFEATAKEVGVSGQTRTKVQRRLDEVRQGYERKDRPSRMKKAGRKLR
jgi:serine/threonine-protein kinase HipA